mmetsp:Transcript_17556/g.37579  ORF Transcript_17556/g.37579 Transcript_17556/m.37579 type:complete len:998 (+) Transcript_17556:219-3212(+)
MDDAALSELYDTCAGLGNFHVVQGKNTYLVNREDCSTCLKDLVVALKHDSQESGYQIRTKLGELKVVADHLVPLLTAYREDLELIAPTLEVLVKLTERLDLVGTELMKNLEHLQDAKEAFSSKDVFIVVIGFLVEHMDEEAENRDTALFESTLALVRQLLSIPDPSPGDAGYNPVRRHMQMVFIQNFVDEGFLDFLNFIGEGLSNNDADSERRGWALADIVYHLCTHIDPEIAAAGNVTKAKQETSELQNLVEQVDVNKRLLAPQSTRHGGWGGMLMAKTSSGHWAVSSVHGDSNNKKNGTLRREFHNPQGRNEKKVNMFHDPFFVDLEEGSVRQHNVLNPHLRSNFDNWKPPLDENCSKSLRKFFEEFLQTCFSSLVQMMRSTLGPPKGSSAWMKQQEQKVSPPGGPFDRPKLMNFVAWFLEFHRHCHIAAVAEAKRKKEKELPVIDIAAIQGAIDLDMLQFTTSRLKEYGKDSGIHVSMLVMTLRALAQQVKTITVVWDSEDEELRTCGEILAQNIIKDDIMANTAWVLKNFKTSTHDLRIMSYSVEVYHYMLKLMRTLSERKGTKLEFAVERSSARFVKRATTTMEMEIGALAEARATENLFFLLEKYRRHNPALTSMLVKLLYQIIRARREHIVVFFELSYFIRIQNIYNDPLVRDKRTGKKYFEMVELLRFILRCFFKCAEKNKMVFVELLFRKVPETGKESLLETYTDEFTAVLDNYENEGYAQILQNMKAGATLQSMRERQKAMLAGKLDWTETEDKFLMERYPYYANHPLGMEMLAAELPEGSRRLPAQIKKRLEELGVAVGAGRKRQQQQQQDMDQDSRPDSAHATGGNSSHIPEPPEKKPRMEDPFAATGSNEEMSKQGDTTQDMDMNDFFAGMEEEDGDVDFEKELERFLDDALEADAEAAQKLDKDLFAPESQQTTEVQQQQQQEQDKQQQQQQQQQEEEEQAKVAHLPQSLDMEERCWPKCRKRKSWRRPAVRALTKEQSRAKR